MKLELEKNHGLSVVTIREPRVDAHNSAELKDYLAQLIESGENRILVRLADVRFIDSSGLGALLSAYKRTAADAGQFALSNVQPQVLSMFEITRLNRVFEIYADAADMLPS
ncbi:STAS domain-containing protein [Methylomonas sp. EFPC3]|uniref:STAS domain-containing protein n=1 Tax=Methylomonas TaxID=416 RepID=UPI00112D4D74|nr:MULTISPECIES: STAS domain-containing protein [Methylomonas]TPQ29084.1 anti-anti-sigma factor [Methylomonas koyamae]WFP50602.1 STAS domain-containing protein [Methylomonas sp. EFPC3]